MFKSLSSRLSDTFRSLSGRGRLTEENIKDSLHEIRRALIEADVALPVIKQFIDNVQAEAIGKDVIKSLKPDQVMVKIVNDELTKAMGSFNDNLQLKTQPPAVVLMAGLQGSGKTTSSAKLALRLKTTLKKKVLLVSCDIYRPAAIEQLKTLANQIEVDFFPSNNTQDPVEIAQAALQYAKTKFFDVLIVDTAGRLHIDETMMQEISAIHKAINPIETLFVVDSMTGQDAATTAKVFNDALPLTGTILTKADGDARGGAALSIRHITQKPIKFIGLGEKIDQLEAFHPDRIASQILGMGDILTLVEEAEQKLDQAKAKKLAKKITKGRGFTLEDFKEQIQQMDKMGGMTSLMKKIPGAAKLPAAMDSKMSEALVKQQLALINSMTPQERNFPNLIKGSRKQRIAAGAGRHVQDVNKLLKQFTQMQKMMKKLGKRGGMQKMMRQMQSLLGGKMPPFPMVDDK